MKVFECLKIFFKRYKLVSFGVFILLVIGLITVPRIFAELQPVKSVEILSEKSNYNEKEAGSWKIDKSASFKTIDTCLVTIDLETISKSSDRGQDIVFIIDTSESMTGEKLNMMKLGVINTINEVLANDKNRVGLTFFNNISSIESNLSNDKELLINKVNSLTVSEGTNYYQALVGLDNFLETYQNNDRDFKVVFITDGLPNMNHPNEVGEYNYLKDKYPYLRVEAVQYEISEDVLEEIENISDKQYVSNRDNFSEIIKSIVKGSNKFEEFRVVDFINSEMFNIEDITDIKVDRGSVSLDNNTISWNLDDVMSFNKARMTYKLKLNKTSERIYPVGEKIKVNSKLGEIVEEIDSPKTPVLSNSYKVIYDGNEPEGCNVDKVPKENSYSVFDTVGISEVEPVCSGYQFKGWDITTSGVSKINDDYFTMPEEDVILKAKWSKLDIKKSMDGKVSQGLTLYSQVAMDALSGDRYAKKYTGSTETFNGNKDVYYYYGEAANNNVIFGDYCWKIVRTTDTGGVKLLYNGVPSSDSKCNNSGDASALTKEQMGTSSADVLYNREYDSQSYYHSSIADVGYMFNKRYEPQVIRKMNITNDVKYGNSFIWDGTNYTLVDTIDNVNLDTSDTLNNNHYTCFNNSGVCEKINYIFLIKFEELYSFTLSYGKNIQDILNEMLYNEDVNQYSSNIKNYVDYWYSKNMIEYTDYLEDTVWCNDRNISDFGTLDPSGILNSYVYFNSKNDKNNLICKNQNDRFTVNKENGNGALSYPVGLITRQEQSLAYVSSQSPLGSISYFTMSPGGFLDHTYYGLDAYVYNVSTDGGFYDNGSGAGIYINANSYVRPAVSLRTGIEYMSGDGSSDTPYVIDMD